tara:strand:+ start:8625 stop:8960 length:336 start_codon:yes stop_codon:yes gene_type:complete
MTKLEIILSAILTLSLLFNLGLFIYARQVVSRLIDISGELGDLDKMITSFSNHLASVYQLETFYGDQTLENLLAHARSFTEQMDTFDYIYYFEDEAEAEEDTLSEEEKDEQ